MADGRLTPAVGTAVTAIVDPAAAAPPRSLPLLGRHAGRCVFLQSSPTSCGVHASLGHDALPLACRQFPRIVVTDPRGVSLTLSHYCPTAAGLLETPGDARIVTDAPAFPAEGEYDGLDASMAMPPLLRPDMMMDWEAWWDFEARAVDALLSAPPATALARLRAIVEQLHAWEPARGPLSGAISAAFEAVGPATVDPWRPTDDERQQRIQEVVSSTPSELAAEHADTLAGVEPMPSDAIAGRFLAAHAFANWAVQLGQGLRTWLRSVEAAQTMLESGIGVRHADLWLRHLADVDRLANTWSESVYCPFMNG